MLVLAAAAEPFDDALQRVREAEAQRVEVFARAARSVVAIFANARAEGGGSGVIISQDGYGLTNYHVVGEMVESRKGVGGLSDGRLYELSVIGIDPGGDVALFKLEGADSFPWSPLGDSDAVRAGDAAAAMGNPFMLAEDYTPTITLGIVSGVHRYQTGQGNALEYADCIQVSTSINPGNSGGPLFNMRGEVIGINGRGSFEERGRVNVGLGYAIGINQIKRFVPCLRAGRLCEHGTLGATVSDSDGRVVFNAVQHSAPAYAAGVRLGDELIELNGRLIRSANQFNNEVNVLPSGWPVTLRLKRGGDALSVVARLERLPVPSDKKFQVDFKHNHAEIRRLFGELGRRFARLAAGGAGRDVVWSGAVVAPPGATPQAVVVQQGAASARVESQDGAALEFSIGDGTAGAEGVPEEVGVAERAWREWIELAAPLLAPPRLGLGWELIEGDCVDGRLVYVIEHRHAGDRRIRWRVDAECGCLREVTIGDLATPEAVRWSLVDSGVHGRGCAERPMPGWSGSGRWVRSLPGGADFAIEVHTLHAAASSSDRAVP
ncbi:MAG: hypothetical protein CHACPFDD_00793 [Phycisphaerae bacterium]|nr:hypothetical protein [Phycisphaerae bacterium]